MTMAPPDPPPHDAADAEQPAPGSGAPSAPPQSGRPAASVPAPTVLDEGTFGTLPRPRRLGLEIGDGAWHQLARAYLAVQLITLGGWMLVIAAAAAVVSAVTAVPWVWLPAGVALAVLAVTAAITPRQIRSFGYRLRTDDLVMRRGILFQRIVAVPYGRMQLVDITHGPLDRALGIAKLRLVTAAAATAVVLPGLTQDGAERLRDTLIAVAETRRTGL